VNEFKQLSLLRSRLFSLSKHIETDRSRKEVEKQKAICRVEGRTAFAALGSDFSDLKSEFISNNLLAKKALRRKPLFLAFLLL